jgi:Leucine-rich repeat (LRR) protein
MSTPPDLERLSGLAHLKELHLPGPLWNRNAGIHTLEALTFSYHFLDRIRFRDEGLDEIKDLTNLRELSLRQSNITGQALGPFRRLRALDATLTRFNDQGMRRFEGMRDLRRLRLGDTNITDTSLAAIGSLKNLEDLDLHGTAITDTGLAIVASLTGLKKLKLMGTGRGRRRHREAERPRPSRGIESLSNESWQFRPGAAQESGQPGGDRLTLQPRLARRRGLVTRSASVRARAVHRALLASSAGERRLRAHWRGVAEVDGWQGAGGGRDLGFPRRRSLNLEGTEVGDAGVRQIVRLSELEELNLSGPTVTDAALAGPAALHHLRKLVLRNTYIEGAGLDRSNGLHALAEVDLEGSPVRNTGIAGLASLRLSLASTDITDSPARSPQATRILDLGSTDLTDAGLEPLKALMNLKELILRDARFTDRGLAHLAGLTNLRTLDLVRTRISDAGLASLSGLDHLTTLRLGYAEVTDAGLTELADLSLDSTLITDKSTPQLRLWTKVKSLNLYHTLVTQQGYLELKSALRDCRIIWDADSSRPNRRRS